MIRFAVAMTLAFSYFAEAGTPAEEAATRAVKVDRVHALRFKQLAREAENKFFLAKTEAGSAQSAVQRAQGVYDRLKNAADASSRREKTLALIEVITKKFELKRALYHTFESKTLADSWNAQAKWALEKSENPTALAKTNRELREKRAEILTELVNDLPKVLELMDEELAAYNQLRPVGAVSQDEFERVQLLTKDAHGLETLAISERKAALRHIEEATEDERVASAPIVLEVPK